MWRCVECNQSSEEVIEIGEDVQAEEEIEPVTVAPSPMRPSAPLVEEHRITHVPYRCWCRECVEGKALGEQRGRRHGDEAVKLIPVVGIDYFYLTSKGVFRRNELEFEENPRERYEAVGAAPAGPDCQVPHCAMLAYKGRICSYGAGEGRGRGRPRCEANMR